MNEIEILFLRAIDPHDVRIDPKDTRYTSPRTWGVYKIVEDDCGSSGKRFREGNHPIRHIELTRRHDETELVALFPSKQNAVRLATRLNLRAV